MWLRFAAFAIVNLFVLTLWAGLLAWLIGRVLTDRFHWSQFLWWIPTPAALLVAVFGWLLAFRSARTPRRRRRRMIAWSACALALLAQFVLIEHRLLRRAPPEPATDQALVIAHWNMGLDNRADIPSLMSSIEALNADVLALTGPPSEVRRLLHESAATREGSQRVIDVGTMTLVSRLPIINWRILVATTGMFITQFDMQASTALGRPVTLFLVDLPSNPRLPRMAMARESRRLLDGIHAPTPDVCIGDFNITRNSASISALFPGMSHAFNRAGHGYGATFHRRFPLYHIDHVLVNEASGLRAVRYDIIDHGQSRHCAQKAWIAVKP